jgi:hypothetical protein
MMFDHHWFGRQLVMLCCRWGAMDLASYDDVIFA